MRKKPNVGELCLGLFLAGSLAGGMGGFSGGPDAKGIAGEFDLTNGRRPVEKNRYKRKKSPKTEEG